MSNIFFYGLKSVGKSTWGKRLAHKLKRPFIDSDKEVENAFEKQKGYPLSCREIFNQFGELFFRNLEKEVIAELVKHQNTIIALGGGSLLNQKNWDEIKEAGLFFYLHLEKWALEKRLFKTPLPFFITKETFDQYYQEQTKLYRSLSSIHIDLTTLSDEMIIKKIIKRVLENGK
ncbi:MAG: shikimate kinase [Simkaniaceae bacterium]